MNKKTFIFGFILSVFWVTPSMAAAPVSNQPAYAPNIPVEFGSGSATPLVPLPPHVPEYLPNGAINLDYVWTEDGGARLYWNNVIIPKELKMGGNTWIDPALVPDLFQSRPVRQVRRSYVRRPARKKVAKAKIPAKVASTSLRSPAIPLPVTPVKQPETIPPLKAPAKAAPVSPADQEVSSVTPPRLQ